MWSDLTLFADVVKIRSEGYSKTRQNLSIAFGVNTIGLPLSIAGIMIPVYAIMVMLSSASIVLVSSLGDDILNLSSA